MLANRLRNTYRHLRKWARRTGVTCYRLYERDIPQHPLVVDWYDGRVLVYAMRRERDTSDEERATWLEWVEQQVLEALDVAAEALFFKERQQRKGGQQYEKLADERAEFVVEEQGHRFLVNLSDYHDTGLFLDHRETRRRIGEEASGKRVLNLFCYTGSFSVYAAAGGAASTTSIDISNTYLEWAARNFELNGLSTDTNRLMRADVVDWLASGRSEGRGTRGGSGAFDLIICDPPTFSNSKKMRRFLDVQSMHPELIAGCLGLLAPGGTLYFSTNDQKFRLNEAALPTCEREEITPGSIPPDFRNRKVHRCWRIR